MCKCSHQFLDSLSIQKSQKQLQYFAKCLSFRYVKIFEQKKMIKTID